MNNCATQTNYKLLFSHWLRCLLWARSSNFEPFGINQQKNQRHKWKSALRAVVSNFRESGVRSENSNFFLFAPKDPFGELFSKIIFKSSSEFLFWQKLGKFEIGQNVPDGPIEIMQISTFSKLSFKTRQRFLELILSQSFLHPLCLLPNYILSPPEHSFI